MFSRGNAGFRAGAAWLCLLAVTAFGGVAAFRFALRWVPLPTGLENDPPPALVLTDRAGRPLRELPGADGGFARPALGLAKIPTVLRQATLAAEDRRFFTHAGVDWRATARACVSQFTPGRRSGGSTVSQQLVKLAALAPAPTRSWRAKAGRMLQALRLEQVWGKARILEAYLNRLPYGNNRVGCAAAAEGYFGKPARDLSAAEAAFLAALPQAPGRLNPYRHFARAKRRQEWVLRRMFADGVLPADDLARALVEPLRLLPRGRVFRAGHFVDLLLAGTARERASRTTLDLALNEFIEGELRRGLAALADREVADGAAVVLDNRTGEVLALVGSPDYRGPRAGQVNGAWAPRSPGSALKPFTHWLALEHGATPATVLADVPAEFATGTGGVYRPENYGRRCSGPVRLRPALACSLNIPAVRALAGLVPGGPAALRNRLADCGLRTLSRPAAHYGLGLTLGDAEVRLLELTNAYACLARMGEHRPVRLLADEPAAPGRRVGDPRAAYLLADILADNPARAPAFGADSPLRWAFPVAVKTGTSTDFRDNWAIGYTPEFTVGVWVGNFNGQPMAGVSGVSGAGPLLHAVFEHLHATRGPLTWFAPPAGIVECSVHPLTGKRLVDAATPGAVREKFLAERLPAPEDPEVDYDAAGRVRLPAEYAGWLAGGEGRALARKSVAAARSDLKSGKGFAIVSPLPGSLYGLDPDLPAASRRLALRTRGCAARAPRWECATLALEPDAAGAGTAATLREGRHVLRAQDPETGEWRETWITVRPL